MMKPDFKLDELPFDDKKNKDTSDGVEKTVLETVVQKYKEAGGSAPSYYSSIIIFIIFLHNINICIIFAAVK